MKIKEDCLFNCDEKLKIVIKMKLQKAQEKLGMKTDIIIPKNTMNSDKCKRHTKQHCISILTNKMHKLDDFATLHIDFHLNE